MLGGRHGISLHLDSLTSSTLPAAGRAASFLRVEDAVQNTPYRLDGLTKRPETFFFTLLETLGGKCHSCFVWGGGRPATSYTGATGMGSSRDCLGRGLFLGEGFGNGFNLGRVEKNKKRIFCCTQGSWGQDRFCDQTLHSVVHFREGDDGGKRFRSRCRSILHI